MKKRMSSEAAQAECSQQWPEGVRVTVGTLSGDGAGIFTDSQGRTWTVDWSQDGGIEGFYATPARLSQAVAASYIAALEAR